MQTYILVQNPNPFPEDFSFGVCDGGHIQQMSGIPVLNYRYPLPFPTSSDHANAANTTICYWLLAHGESRVRPDLQYASDEHMVVANSSRVIQTFHLPSGDFPLVSSNAISRINSLTGNFQIDGVQDSLKGLLTASNVHESTSLAQDEGITFRIYEKMVGEVDNGIGSFDYLTWVPSNWTPESALDAQKSTGRLSLIMKFGDSKIERDCYASFLVRHVEDKTYLDGIQLIESVNCMDYPLLQLGFLAIQSLIAKELDIIPGIFISDIMDCWFPDRYGEMFTELVKRVAVQFHAKLNLNPPCDVISFVSLSVLNCRMFHPERWLSYCVSDLELTGYPSDSISHYTGDIHFEPIVTKK